MSLYEEYGELMIKAEIIQARIQEVKRKIAEDMNKKQTEPKETKGK